MKLRDRYITELLQYGSGMMSGNGSVFYAFVRGNESAAFIAEMLQRNVSENEICDAMQKTYGASRPVIEEDVKRILSRLREMGVIEE